MTNEGITQLQIDRMVDGELSSSQQRELLLACETGDRWRDLALAYVESQVLSNALGESSFLIEQPANVLANSPSNASETQPNEASAESQTVDVQTEKAREQNALSWNTWSLAAAVLLSLGMGYGLGWWWQGVEPGDPINVVNTTPSHETPESPQLALGNGTSNTETMPFWVSDSSGSEMRQVELPLVNASDLGPNWQQDLQRPNLPSELVRELREGGMKLRQQRTMIRVRRPDGRLVLVPIDYFYEELFQ